MTAHTSPEARGAHLLCVSAHDEVAFRRRASTLADHLAGVATTELDDVCFTLHTSGEHHDVRAAVIGNTGGELAEALRHAVPRRSAGRDDARVALMFTGQGSQYPGMARGLYAAEPAFRTAFDEAAACFGRELGAPLQALVLDGVADSARLAETDLTQPAVFTVDYAMGRLLLDWGVRPHCLLGHSVGEYVAACLAGALALPSAARVIRERGRLMHELPTRGAMVAVFASADRVERLLDPIRDRVFVAAYNGGHIVLAGDPDALAGLEPQLDRAGLVHKRLAVSQAFHTPLLRPMIAAFQRAFDGLATAAPSITLISNVTGRVVDRPLDAEYWVQHVLEPVRFAQSIQAAIQLGTEIFLEAGPDRVLSEMCRGLLETAQVAVPTLRRKGDDASNVRAAMGELYVRGGRFDLRALHSASARRVRGLPAYPLAAVSLGRPVGTRPAPKAPPPQAQPAPAVTPAIWAWTAEVPRRRAAPGHGRLLVVAPARFGSALERALGRAGDRWILVDPTAVGSPASRMMELARLVAAAQTERPISGVVHLLGGWTEPDRRDPAWDDGVELGVHGLVSLAKTLGSARDVVTIPLVLATRGAMGVAAGEAPVGAWQSPAIVVAQGLALEEPWLEARALDLAADTSDDALVRAALDELAIEPPEERIAAVRAGQRLTRVLRPAAALEGGTEPWQPRDGETYLLVGAAGGIGAELALHIARRARVHLVITSRRPLLPPGSVGDAEAAERTRLIQALEQTGTRVRYEAVDVTDRSAMAELVRRTRAEFGPIHGVVHCAGVVDSEALKLTGKTAEGLRRVLAPKVRGIAILDEVTRDEPLRFFAAFSSISASRCAWSKCIADYAAANFFLDQYCLLRAARGGRGRSVAINWSLWRSTGMGRTPGLEAVVERSGLEALQPEVALRTFDEAIARTDAVLHVFQALRPGAEHRPAFEPNAPSGPGEAVVGEAETLRVVLEVLGQQLRVSASAIDDGKSFRELGVDSLAAVEALRGLEARLHRKLYPTLFFEFKTPAELARYLSVPGANAIGPSGSAAVFGPPAPAVRAKRVDPSVATVDPRDIAIVGMACRFPGGESPEAYWALLCSGKTVIGEAPAQRFPADMYYDASGTAAHASYSRWGAFLEDPYAFDAMYFGISPREAISMDPQQRIFLEVAWQTIQRAGYARSRPADLGVFVGCETNAYVEHFINSQRHAAILGALGRAAWFEALTATARADLLATLAHHLAPAEITSDVVAGNGLNEVAARVSHFLDAHGPSLIVNSACSSSLVALHCACDSIRRGETAMALAGGVFLNLGTTASVFLSKLKALSPTGECRPFDRRANGMVLGEGAAAFLLKPLSAALRDRDHVHAVIKGSAVNNDGHSSGITVPTASGQGDAIRRAYQEAGIEAATVSYVECHGTATPLGDPIEIQGLVQSIGGAGRSTPCTIGSVKGAVGHALAAAGASSVLKVAMALEARTIPPTAGYDEPTAHVDFGAFEVAHGAPRPWAGSSPRRAGVNAFGFGGTNCHLILEQAPEVADVPDRASSHLLCLYGRTPESLHRWADNVKHAVLARSELAPGAVCASLDRSQRPLAHVAACVVHDRADLLAALAAITAGSARAGLHRGKVNPRRNPRLVLALGAEGLPTRADAESLAGSSPQLAAALADDLAVLRGAQPELARLVALYVVVRALEVLGLHADEIVGDGQAAVVATCLRGQLTASELAAGAASHGAAPAVPAAGGAATVTVVLALGAPSSFIARQGLGDALTVHTGHGPITRPWALDLLAQLLAHGGAPALAGLQDERPVHVPLADYPFERTTYRACDEASGASSSTSASVALPPRATPRTNHHA